jgi:MoCo/4Fe-4S cofactor protein with predicted Tat translocation signal
MSKRIIEHPAPKAGDLVGQDYWRSLDEKTGTPEFKEWLNREFPEGSSEASGFNRRHFLKMMGASFGLAGLGLAGCREPRNHTLPYAKQPENQIPGVALYFATSFPGATANQPILVETHQYRPTKIEGNTSYGPNGTATCKFAQSSILDLYDVDRAAGSQNAAGRILPKDIALGELASIAKEALAANGAGFAFLAAPSSSPTRARLIASLKKKLPQALWTEYAPVPEGAADRAASKLAGRSVRLRPDYAAAKRVLSLDADFLDAGDDATASQRAFAQARRIDNPEEVVAKMNRLYAVESTFTLTGAQADHRLRASASSIPAIAALFVAEVLTQTGGALELADTLRTKAAGLKLDDKWVKESVADLVAHRGSSLIVAGDHLPEAVHALVALANARLGAAGKTLSYVSANDTVEKTFADLADALKAGTVKTLVVLGGNPVYDAPADLEFAKIAKGVRIVRHGFHGPNADETSEFAKASPGGLFLAAPHYLESWNDGRAPNGTYVPVQPMIEPLFPCVNELEVVAAFAGVTGDAYGLVKETFAALGGKNFEAWLAEGVLPESGYNAISFSPADAKVADLVAAASFEAPALSGKSLEVRIVPSTHAYDGRYANNGWLAENPDPMLKTNWENVIAISPKLAEELKVEPQAMFINTVGQLNRNINQLIDGKLTAHVATLTLNGRKVTGPLFILPGMPDYTVSVQLGFGRRKVGRIGTRVIDAEKHLGTGYDAYPLTAYAAPAYAAGVKLELTGETAVVANTQDHWSMEGRDIIREANVSEYAADPAFASKMGPDAHSPKVYGASDAMTPAQKSLLQPRGNSAYEHPTQSLPMPNVAVWKGAEDKFPIPQQWGMSIDLNTCTGCNACVVACQAENNIPIVGRDQTLKGRDMRWIRLDRYFYDGRDAKKDGTLAIPEDPQVTFMSVACMHCETAPCESVCPANATVHDQEGLNVMAYNRCIGTRYCANNCPYKVRRFNFLDYANREVGHFYEGPVAKQGGFLGGKDLPELPKMQKNPNVSVRMRGVMEKCTFCIQRIQEAKIKVKADARDSADVRVADGVIKVACEQACASESIVFGDVSDENSRVSKLKRSKRDYGALSFLNTRPRTTYLAKLRNPNPKMPGATPSLLKLLSTPLSKAEYDSKNPAPHHGEGHGEHGHAEHAAHEHAEGTHH